MVMRKALLGLAASSLVLGSTVAQASTVELRAPAAVSEVENFGGSSFGWILALLIAIGAIAVAAGGGDGDTPEEPISP